MNSDEVRKQWAERSGEYSPSYYAYYGPNETSDLILDLLDSFVGSDAAVLELGCSSGRHLAHLHDHGFEDLHGVEINDEAFDVMADAYPDLAEAGTFYHDAIESAAPEFPDRRFDAVFSVETLQHIHPDDDAVFGELARITDDALLTVENEDRDGESQEGDATASRTEGDGEDDVPDDVEEEARRGVNYVREEFPLYYRDWSRIFTELGFAEVECRTTKRDTLRAFRRPN
ncbi:methyltransferase domain-containing protein [Halorussus gelatinilyticus]|uniref:Methyltransferase domain-containing protein n=1 Tax=Halorussus gelatinilyticus TaxID=2937524 RepID=A0A8U0IHY2_9EURY|nr:class I SAM-dependent methyltransferase [Halorussus gelatinilyticus]UPV99688.1 methyltransferase domain-containing protein [Halorussus gelatinilyticus]